MGNMLGNEVPHKKQEGSISKKRSIDEVDAADLRAQMEEENLHTPKRKKLKSTSKYIYDTLFVKGENSDVTIEALGKQWKLHKVYLCQAGYFCSMFSRGWKESRKDTIQIDIPDENIDQKALDTAFGSLYREDIMITPVMVVSVLAAATHLGLDGLIQQCADIMKETISAKTVCAYHIASVMYGQQVVTQKCFSWLEKNIMSNQDPELLAEIGKSAMEKLVQSQDLFVMQVEMDVYSMLKKWLFLQLNPSWTGSSKSLSNDSDSFYKKRERTGCFLDSEQGRLYTSVYKQLRLQHVIADLASSKVLEQDKIIPQSWLLPLYKVQWIQMLKIEQAVDKGIEDINFPQFHQLSMRCGRILTKEGEYCWRWTGFNYGLDMIMSVTNSRLVTIKRNTYSQNTSGSVSLQSKRNIVFRVTVASLDSLGQTNYIKDSGVLKVTLGKDEEAVALSIDSHVKFPLHVGVNWLMYQPLTELLPSSHPGFIESNDVPSVSASEEILANDENS